MSKRPLDHVPPSAASARGRVGGDEDCGVAGEVVAGEGEGLVRTRCKSEEEEEGLVRVRYTSGEEASVARGCVTIQKQRSPIDAWPDSFIFFDRVLGLLRGLTASLEVSVSYLEVMTPFAREALLEYERARSTDNGAQTKDVLGGVGEPISPVDPVSGESKIKGLVGLVKSLVDSKLVLGCQVAVMQKGLVLADIAAGASDPYTLAPVRSDSVFNVFSVTKAVTATALLLAVQRGDVHLDAPVHEYWPDFLGGKSNVTVRNVLNHKAGLSDAGTEEMSQDPFVVCDTDAMLQIMAAATPSQAPGGKAKYHYLSFGWLVDGILRGACGRSLAQVVAQDIAVPLNISDELLIGLGPGGHASLKAQGRLTELTLKRSTANISGAPEPVAEGEGEEREGGPPRRRPVEGGLLLLNPTFFNNPRIREAEIPAANGHFSARALAKFYWALMDSSHAGLYTTPLTADGVVVVGGQGRDNAGNTGANVEDESMLQGGEGSFFNGYSVYGTGEKGRVMIGHGGVGGSIALCDPATGTSVAVTLNRLSMDSSSTSGAILRLIFEQLNLPCPSTFKPMDSSGLEKMIKGKKLFSGVPTEQEKEWRGKVTAR